MDGILHTFDEALKKHGEGWVLVTLRDAKKTAAPDNLFVVNENFEKQSIHTIVAKLLYVSKQARLDTSLSIPFLTTRVGAPDTNEWVKLSHLMEYLRGDRDQPLVLDR